MSLPPAIRVQGLDPAHLAASVGELFRPFRGATPRIGVEVEAIPLDAHTLRPVPPEPDSSGPRSLLPALARWAATRGWPAGRTYAGSPAFVGPHGGTLSFEPGGQLEYASPPTGSLDLLHDDVTEVLGGVGEALAREGIVLVARGVDPVNALADARLHVAGERYRRMAAHYARRGPWGRRMMRQTAALHLNVDAPGAPFEAWGVATAAVPALLAAFANSPRVEGTDTGHRSARAAQWRCLDPTRTGLVAADAPDPEAAYLAFALGADAFLLGPEGEPARPFREWLPRADSGDWSAHLSTLFPEVRPRGYLEIRSVDALPLSLVQVPAAVVVGLLFHAPTRARARGILPSPHPDLLERAGRLGVGDHEVAALAGTVFDLALEGLSALGRAVASPVVLGRVEEFRSTYTARGLDPGHRTGDALLG